MRRLVRQFPRGLHLGGSELASGRPSVPLFRRMRRELGTLEWSRFGQPAAPQFHRILEIANFRNPSFSLESSLTRDILPMSLEIVWANPRGGTFPNLATHQDSCPRLGIPESCNPSALEVLRKPAGEGKLCGDKSSFNVAGRNPNSTSQLTIGSRHLSVQADFPQPPALVRLAAGRQDREGEGTRTPTGVFPSLGKRPCPRHKLQGAVRHSALRRWNPHSGLSPERMRTGQIVKPVAPTRLAATPQQILFRVGSGRSNLSPFFAAVLDWRAGMPSRKCEIREGTNGAGRPQQVQGPLLRHGAYRQHSSKVALAGNYWQGLHLLRSASRVAHKGAHENPFPTLISGT